VSHVRYTEGTAKLHWGANPRLKASFAILSTLLLSCPLGLFALEEKPWVGNLYECTLDAGYTYSRFTKVEGAVSQPHYPFNDSLLFFDLGATLSQSFDLQAEVEFVRTPVQHVGWRSAALQGRYQILDDISGDPVSLLVGLSSRFVSKKSLTDVSCPYAARLDFELFASVGKEWSSQGFWISRTYAFTAIGQGTNGSPWLRADLIYEHDWANRHRLVLFTNTNWGFGGRDRICLSDFDGWGHYHHQSIDLGAGYCYVFSYWGKLRLSYAYRLYAKSFPERVQSITLSYHLPFSFF
jgi:hypothetical protein